MVELAYWEGDLKLGQRRQHDYNCQWCERRGMWNRPGKGCFKHYATRFVPQSEVTDRGFSIGRGPDVEASAGQVLDMVGVLTAAQPDRGAFDVCRMLRVCPTGLLDPDDWALLALEGAAREYGASYFAAYGLDPVPATTLDAMQVIRSTRNEIEARKWKSHQQKVGTNG